MPRYKMTVDMDEEYRVDGEIDLIDWDNKSTVFRNVMKYMREVCNTPVDDYEDIDTKHDTTSELFTGAKPEMRVTVGRVRATHDSRRGKSTRRYEYHTGAGATINIYLATIPTK